MYPLEDYEGQLAEMESENTDGIDTPCLEDGGYNMELNHSRNIEDSSYIVSFRQIMKMIDEAEQNAPEEVRGQIVEQLKKAADAMRAADRAIENWTETEMML